LGWEEHGLKCSICGEREVLGREGASFADERRGWRELVPQKTSWVAEGEALCGPCWVKRWVGLESLDFRHPSTGEIAASRFKLEVIRACQTDTAPALCEAVSNFVRAAEQAVERADLNVWCSQAVLDAARGDKLLEEFSRIDGQYLLPWPRERGGERQEQVWRDLLRAGGRVRGEAKRRGLSAPRAYLAAVHFDGDEIGKWLGGDHTSTPTTREMLHYKIREQLKEVEGLKTARRVTPAIHAALSEACVAFSQIGAPLTVEGEGLPAHLVYAGGDDALVLAPVDDVLELVRRLRLRFSGYPWEFDLQRDYEVPEGSDAQGDLHARARSQPFRYLRGYVVCRRGESGMPRPGDDEVRLAFGGRVTASAGMCVFHYTWPLGDALERMREAEKLAKDELGRNAVGIAVVRRSGSVTRTGLKFVPDDDNSADSVRTLQRLVTAFRTALSPRLYTNLAADLAPLRLGDSARSGTGATVEQRARDVELWEIALALGRRASKRRADGDQAPADLPRWLESLASACGRPESGASGILRWLDLIGTAAFLGRPGEVGS
jgi:CRISPR-associated protein Cas10/Cmr2 subtype III-B